MVKVTEIPNFQGQPINAPRANPNSAAATGQALGNLAQSIAGVSDAFSTQAHRIQQSENVRLISEAKNTLARDYAEFQIDLQNDPDPQSRIRRTEEFLTNHKSLLDQPDYSPAVRDTLTKDYDTFANRAYIHSIEDAAKLSNTRATAAMENNIALAKQHNDPVLFQDTIKTGRENGLILPEHADALEADFDRNIALLGLDNDIFAEPAETLEKLQDETYTNSLGLTETDRKRALKVAQNRVQELRSEEIEILETALLEGKLTPRDIEAAEHLTKRDRINLKHSLGRKKPPSHEDHQKSWEILDNLRQARDDGKITDPQYREFYNEARSSVLARIPPDFQGDLKRELNYLTPAGRSTIDRTSPNELKSELEAASRAQIARALSAGMFGLIETDTPHAIREQAYRKAEDLRIAAKKFLLQNPRATLDETRQHLDNLIGQAIDFDILPNIPPPIDVTGDLDSFLPTDTTGPMVLPPLR